jgi:hypothetical protein
VRGLRMADHVIDAKLGEDLECRLRRVRPQAACARSRDPRRAAHAAAPGCHRPEMTAATALPGSAGSASYDCPDVTGHVAPAPDISSDY